MSFNWKKKEQSIMTSSAGDTNILIEKNREVPLEVKAKMDRRYLPKNLHKTFREMVGGDSIFLESDNPKCMPCGLLLADSMTRPARTTNWSVMKRTRGFESLN